VQILKPLISRAWAVSIDAPRGMTAGQAARQIGVARLEATFDDVAVVWKQAREWAVAEPGRLVVITGSLYLKQMLASAGLA
jgi:folylpolyglutamate synthase/dihydropteroate synthase